MNKRNRTLKPLLLAAPLWLPFNASAEELLSEQSFFDNMPTMMAGTRLEQRQREIPAAVTLIDRQMIESSGAVNISDLLRLVPGFQVYHVNANKHSVISHGQGEIHPGRLEVMIDGRSVYSAIVSTVDWKTLGITLDDIDHIEVVRGTNVVTHGSNAFLGAINIITRQPLQQRGTQLRLLGGNLNTREVGLTSAHRWGDMDLRLSAAFAANDGTGIGDDNDPITDAPVRTRIEDGGEISQLSLRGIYTPSLADTFDFNLGISDGVFGMGNANHPLEYEDREVKSHFQNLTWTRALDGGDQLKVQAYHNYTRYNQNARQLISQLLSEALGGPIPAGTPVPSYDQIRLALIDLGADEEDVTVENLRIAIPNLDQITGEPDQLVDIDSEEGSTHRYDLELEYTGQLSNELRIIGGAGWRMDRIKTLPQLNRTDYVTDVFYRLFSNLEWQPSDHWTFNGGAMFEYNTLIGGRLSPRLGANWHLNRNHTLRAGLSQAYRNPSLLDWYQHQQIVLPSNGAVLDVISATFGPLNPERVRNAELGYLFQTPYWESTLDVRVFYEQIDDALSDFRRNLSELGLTEVGNDEVFENRNSSYWSNRGVDLQWQLKPSATSHIHLAYSYLSANGKFERGGIVPLGGDVFVPKPAREQPPQRAPRHTLGFLAGKQFSGGWQLSGAIYRISDTFYFKGKDVGHTRVDGRLAKQVNVGKYLGSIELIAQNLLNDTYLEFEKNNEFDRRLFLRFVLKTQ